MAVDAFAAGKPVGAICHGVLVAARARDPRTERSVLLRPRHDGVDVVAREQGLGHGALDTLLGRQLLPHLRGGAGPTRGLHVGPAGGDAGAGRAVGLQGRDQGHAGLAAQVQRPGARLARPMPVRPSSSATAPTSRHAGPGDAFTFAQTFAAVLAEHDVDGADQGSAAIGAVNGPPVPPRAREWPNVPPGFDCARTPWPGTAPRRPTR